MSPHDIPVGGSPLGFPRVSGDEPAARSKHAGEAAFSPRERG